jgi:hypothetical protein
MSLLTLFQNNQFVAPMVLPFREYVATARTREFTALSRDRDFTAPVRTREFTAGS